MEIFPVLKLIQKNLWPRLRVLLLVSNLETHLNYYMI